MNLNLNMWSLNSLQAWFTYSCILNLCCSLCVLEIVRRLNDIPWTAIKRFFTRQLNRFFAMPSQEGKKISLNTILTSLRTPHWCPGLNASIVYLILHIWQGYLIFSYYFIFDSIVCVLVTFYRWGHFVMLIIRNLNLISVQSWTYLESPAIHHQGCT